MRDGKLPRARQALLSDAIAICGGAVLGTSTVTSYIESAAGISAGGRTGLTGIVVTVLFLLSIFFSPLVHMMWVQIGERNALSCIASAPIIREYDEISPIWRITRSDTATLVMMPLTSSEGISLGHLALLVS
jgi:AGZA family xanthine/uracil permease-like MFS transporter